MMNDTAVRAKAVKSALSFAPPPYGVHDNQTDFDGPSVQHRLCAANRAFDFHVCMLSSETGSPRLGLFFDIECTIEPCPWLYREIISGMTEFFKELKVSTSRRHRRPDVSFTERVCVFVRCA